MILFVCLGLAGTLQVLQTIVVEVIQRRQFVRIVGDLAHRFPRATAKSLEGVFPREFANRFFDIMTIQKASAALLLDGISVVLTTAMGMALLGFYHPFLLGFDIVLLFCMIIIVWAMGRGGIRTAIDESVEKYRVAHWLQDVIASPLVFKYQGGEGLAVHRANQLTVNYIRARESQFAVVIRQVASSIALYVIASTVLLALGGWLVINGQLTLGQLVASELVVTVVVGAFVKGGKAIEKFYDLMGGIDKVGHLLDMPTDILHEMSSLPPGPAEISWSPLQFSAVAVSTVVPAMTISAGSVVAIVGDDSEGRIFLSQCLGGLIDPASGEIQMGGFNLSIITRSLGNPLVCFASNNDLFHGTVRENVELGRSNIGLQKVRDALHRVGLDEVLLKLPDGVQTELQTHGYPLTDLQARRIVLARAIVVEPKLLVIDRLLDDLSDDALDRVWQALSGENRPWTLVINTNRHDIASMCDSRIVIQNES
jgi:putative ABC transport system ATP-binding protein